MIRPIFSFWVPVNWNITDQRRYVATARRPHDTDEHLLLLPVLRTTTAWSSRLTGWHTTRCRMLGACTHMTCSHWAVRYLVYQALSQHGLYFTPTANTILKQTNQQANTNVRSVACCVQGPWKSRFSTNTSLYFWNDTRCGHSYNGRLTVSLVCLLNCTIFNDPEWPLTQISKAHSHDIIFLIFDRWL